MARRGRAAPRRPFPARSPRRGGAPAIMAPTISSTRRGKRSRRPTFSTRRANLALPDLLRSHSFTHGSPGASSDRMAPRRSMAQQFEEFLRKMDERIDQKVDQLFGQMHQGPSNPVLTSPSSQQSSCASVTPPEMDLAHYHADNITCPSCKELVDEAHHDAQRDEDDASADSEDHVHDHSDEDENLLVHRHAAVLSVRAINTTSTPRNDAPRFAYDTLVGKDVILYAMLRSYLPVAKGTVISTNPSTMLGGQSLGRQFCQVVVNLVLKRDAFLPRPYAEMETMADAYMKSISWPYNKLKLSNKASILSQGAAGTSKKC